MIILLSDWKIIFCYVFCPFIKRNQPNNRNTSNELVCNHLQIVRTLHKDVITLMVAHEMKYLVLLDRYGELLINDGISKFEFGGHNSQDEIVLKNKKSLEKHKTKVLKNTKQ